MRTITILIFMTASQLSFATPIFGNGQILAKTLSLCQSLDSALENLNALEFNAQITSDKDLPAIQTMSGEILKQYNLISCRQRIDGNNAEIKALQAKCAEIQKRISHADDKLDDAALDGLYGGAKAVSSRVDNASRERTTAYNEARAIGCQNLKKK